MIFNNLDVRPQWKKALQVKEQALKTRYVKTLESLSEHSRSLPALDVGDQVMIQNQSGRFPKKWDKSGVVIDMKDNDQHVVKVNRSGRLTLRNRRFLRKYESHGKQNAEWNHAQAQKASDVHNCVMMSTRAKQAASPRQTSDMPSGDGAQLTEAGDR